jgi:nitrogen regulatory protein PII
MHSVKRIEIISDSVELTKIVAGLKSAGVTNYTVIRNVSGTGGRNSRDSSDLDMARIENDYVIAFCLPEEIKSVAEAIRPILNKFGGTCYISDAIEIKSMRCVAALGSS